MKNWLDVFIVLLCVYAIWKGYLRGFLREILEILGIIAAFVIANHYSPELAVYLTNNWAMQKNLSAVLSYAIILAFVAIATQIIIYLLSSWCFWSFGFSYGWLFFLNKTLTYFSNCVEFGCFRTIAVFKRTCSKISMGAVYS